MKRTQRNLFIIMSVMMVVYLLIVRLPPAIAIGVAAAMLCVVLLLSVIAYDYFIARHHTKRRRWRAAVERFVKFEKKLVSASWRGATVLVYLSIYTFDALAIVRNEIAQALMNLDEFEAAERWLKGALERDLQYSPAYVNLGAIAAIRRDAVTARKHISRAVHLGYSPEGAQQVLRRALARGNAAGAQHPGADQGHS
jgi:tetratricopeptide (TPR) repeat protein